MKSILQTLRRLRLDDFKTQISFRLIFETKEEINKIRPIVEPKNDVSFD